jgi:hypothetical protein
MKLEYQLRSLQNPKKKKFKKQQQKHSNFFFFFLSNQTFNKKEIKTHQAQESTSWA